MAESGKPKWFYKLEPKPSSKHQKGIIGPVQHIRLFRDFSFSNIQKSKIAEKSYMFNSAWSDLAWSNYSRTYSRFLVFFHKF